MTDPRQTLSRRDCVEILERGETGVLSFKGLGDYPYAVPVNYVYADGKLLVHGKAAGTKVDCLRADPHVSFCVIGEARVIPEEYTTVYRSVIATGTARLLMGRAEKLAGLERLMEKYAPGVSAPCMGALETTDFPELGILEITIAEMTGKCSG